MDRQKLIDRLTPKARYQENYAAPLCRMKGRYLFAATHENAGYFLLADDNGKLQPLTQDTYWDLIEEARLLGIKLRNMRVFGAPGALKRAPGVRFYPIEQTVAA